MRRILVTGANKGIGLAIVATILEDENDTEVLLGSRDLSRGLGALETLSAKNAAWRERIHLLELDVSRDDSVASAANQVRGKFSDGATPLYGIVNNAGIGYQEGDLAKVLQVNAYGIRRVCSAFLPLLDPVDGRIVNLTSAAGPSFVSTCSPSQQEFFLDADIQWEDLDAFMQECIALEGADAFAAKGLGDGDAYGLSKACANSVTLLFARENPKLLVNACTPGFIETDLTRPFAEKQGKDPADMGMKSPAEGAASALFLLFGAVEGSGHYYGSDAKRSPLDRYRAPGSAPYTGTP